MWWWAGIKEDVEGGWDLYGKGWVREAPALLPVLPRAAHSSP
jgi:hypothetical protein